MIRAKLTCLVAILGAATLAGIPAETACAASFVGSRACATCHEQAYRDWSGSHHDLAMQNATRATVLGDFDDTTFTAYGVTSRFFTKDDDYYVNTEGPDGELRDYRIAFTFGVYPLQQYLIAFPDGRYQALALAWDTRPTDEGGQRWFHLYAHEHITPGDPLHWTGINQNWNYMCADCHSTNLRRNFDLENDRYETTWSEIDVSCEACHGPGSAHVTWAEAAKTAGTPPPPATGLDTRLDERRNIRWTLKPDAVTAARSAPPASFRAEVETCGRCHARRSPLGDTVHQGKPLLDSYRVALLTEPLYHADGQILDEVYVYGSFLQSKMYRAGVTCSDCHMPHSLKLRAEGNDLCTRCHLPEAFDTRAHHFHAAGEAGSRCVDCHAPETTYMVVDPRRDHSFRVPRPDLSVKLGVPNACTGCHEKRNDAWAAATVDRWHGADRPPEAHYGEAIAAARAGEPGSRARLMALAGDRSRPSIVRATALEILGGTLDAESFPVVRGGLADGEALVRLAATQALEPLGVADRYQVAYPLLDDPIRAVRLQAARLLAPVPLDRVPPEQAERLQEAFAQYERTLVSLGDRPESLTALANFHHARGATGRAEAEYRRAIARHPWFTPAYVNLADLLRATGRDGEGEKILRRALATAPADAATHHALGLALIRGRRYEDAAHHLETAARLAPESARYAYVHGLAVQQVRGRSAAIAILTQAHTIHPRDRDILLALATMSRDVGRADEAVAWAEKLVEIAPGDPNARRLLEELEATAR